MKTLYKILIITCLCITITLDILYLLESISGLSFEIIFGQNIDYPTAFAQYIGDNVPTFTYYIPIVLLSIASILLIINKYKTYSWIIEIAGLILPIWAMVAAKYNSYIDPDCVVNYGPVPMTIFFLYSCIFTIVICILAIVFVNLHNKNIFVKE